MELGWLVNRYLFTSAVQRLIPFLMRRIPIGTVLQTLTPIKSILKCVYIVPILLIVFLSVQCN